MSLVLEASEGSFVDRRSTNGKAAAPIERRQFSNTHDHLSPAAKEFALAVDEYKLANRRRFITYEELLTVVTGLGYQK